eukprot:jgi/Psemu1/39667/gm1.39667_g
MTRTNNKHGKRPPASNCNKEGNKAKRVRVEDPPPNTPAKHDDNQRKYHFRKTTPSTSRSEKKGRGKKKIKTPRSVTWDLFPGK